MKSSPSANGFLTLLTLWWFLDCHAQADSVDWKLTTQYVSLPPPPTPLPSASPSESVHPSSPPSGAPTSSASPSAWPSIIPSPQPSASPSDAPSVTPSASPSDFPSLIPSAMPSDEPSISPSSAPSTSPSSAGPSSSPVMAPTTMPSTFPSSLSQMPSHLPSNAPSSQPTDIPFVLSASPSEFGAPAAPRPTGARDTLSATPSLSPSTSDSPSYAPSLSAMPSSVPSVVESTSPSLSPSLRPSRSFYPSTAPSSLPSLSSQPSLSPSAAPSSSPSSSPSAVESANPTFSPSVLPSDSESPSNSPSNIPSEETSSSPIAFNYVGLPTPTTSQPTSASIESNSTVERAIMVTAVATVTLKDQNSTMDLEQIAIFQSITLKFLTHHYTHMINNNGIKFSKVNVVNQVPKQYTTRRNVQEAPEIGFVDDDASTRSLPFVIDIDVVFEIVGEILPGDGFVFMDFQWLVDTMFNVNMDDFYARLDETGEFRPVGIEGRTDTSTDTSESEVSTGIEFRTWMIASIGACVLSVFLTAVLVTRATRRTRLQTAREEMLAPSSSGSQEYASSASPFDNDFSSRYLGAKIPSGLSAGVEEESLDGMRLIRSASTSKSAVSTLGASIHRGHDSIFIPVEQTNEILQKLSSEKPEEANGLNARMKKRLIEREVQSNGHQAGLSMQAILQASGSFASDEDEPHQGLRISVSSDGTENPSPVAVPQGSEKEYQHERSSGGGYFSSWFGRKGRQAIGGEEAVQQENRNQVALDSAQLHSPYQQSTARKGRRRSERMSLPSNAEIITVGESVRDDHYPITPADWNHWDGPPAVKAPVLPEMPEQVQDARIKRSPFKLVKNIALLAMGRGGASEPMETIQLSDEYDENVDENQVPYVPSPLRDLGVIRSSKDRCRLTSSSPVWLSEEPDTAIGLVQVQPRDSTAGASRRSSHSEFPLSPRRFSGRPPRLSVATESTAASSWKRPGKIKTEFAESTPLKRRLARARADPPVRHNPSQQIQKVKQRDQYQQEREASDHQREPHTSVLARPHSKVHLIKKGSKLSKMQRSRVSVGDYSTTTSIGGGRIGAAPLVEMGVASNTNAMILGSMQEKDGGLELEWGMTI